MGLAKEEPTNEIVQELLTEFGSTLIKLGRKAWMIQANALSHTSYAGSTTDGKLESVSGEISEINEKLKLKLKVEEITAGLEN